MRWKRHNGGGVATGNNDHESKRGQALCAYMGQDTCKRLIEIEMKEQWTLFARRQNVSIDNCSKSRGGAGERQWDKFVHVWPWASWFNSISYVKLPRAMGWQAKGMSNF